MAQKSSAVYANVVMIRVTDHELVLDFGSNFPTEPSAGEIPADFSPDVRIVLPAAALPGLIKTMTQMQQRQKPKAASADGEKQAPALAEAQSVKRSEKKS